MARSRRLRKRRLHQLAEVEDPFVARRCAEGAQQGSDPRTHTFGYARHARRTGAQESLALFQLEPFDQRLRAERGLEGGERRERLRLQEIEDQVIEIAFAHARGVCLAQTIEVRGKCGFADAAGVELFVEGSEIRPGGRNLAVLRVQDGKGENNAEC